MEGTEQERQRQSNLGGIQRKWGDALGSGFQVIPNVLVRAQNRLGLDAIDVVILLNLTAHWWEEGDKPFVSPAVIGKRMNVSRRTVERHLKRLEDRNLIGRDPRGVSHSDGPYIRHYDMAPLVAVLKEASRNSLEERRQRAGSKV